MFRVLTISLFSVVIMTLTSCGGDDNTYVLPAPTPVAKEEAPQEIDLTKDYLDQLPSYRCNEHSTKYGVNLDQFCRNLLIEEQNWGCNFRPRKDTYNSMCGGGFIWEDRSVAKNDLLQLGKSSARCTISTKEVKTKIRLKHKARKHHNKSSSSHSSSFYYNFWVNLPAISTNSITVETNYWDITSQRLGGEKMIMKYKDHLITISKIENENNAEMKIIIYDKDLRVINEDSKTMIFQRFNSIPFILETTPKIERYNNGKYKFEENTSTEVKCSIRIN